MFLSLENIGKIHKADIEIKGITIIAGENNTGKSTVGKVLYSIFNSFYHIEEQIYQQKKDSIFNDLSMLQISNGKNTKNYRPVINLVELIIKNQGKYIKDTKKLMKDVEQFLYRDSDIHINTEAMSFIFKHIVEILKIKNEDFFNKAMTNRFNAEFASQINNIYTEKDGQIHLTIKDKTMDITVTANNIKLNSTQKSLDTEAIYIDDPFVVDELPSMYLNNSDSLNDHRNDLKHKLYIKKQKQNMINEMVSVNKLNNIYEQLNPICDGSLENDNNEFGYRKAGAKQRLDVRNISTGLKTFVILKTLLQKGWIETKGTIILDEPEIHLHPEWQLLFARLIVLLQKELDMHILLNTHSPYFLNAIEVYSAKYNIADKCKYYLAYLDNDIASIKDVTDNTEMIYAKLAKPLQDLENERYNNDR